MKEMQSEQKMNGCPSREYYKTVKIHSEYRDEEFRLRYSGRIGPKGFRKDSVLDFLEEIRDCSSEIVLLDIHI